MTKFRIWLYSLFEPVLLNFLMLTFPGVRQDTVHSLITGASEEPEQKPRGGDLQSIYNNARNPQASFRIFHLRVKHFGWDINHALKTPDRKDEIRVAGYVYNLREIFNNAPMKKISYHTFHRRVTQQGWDPRKALETPPNK